MKAVWAIAKLTVREAIRKLVFSVSSRRICTFIDLLFVDHRKTHSRR